MNIRALRFRVLIAALVLLAAPLAPCVAQQVPPQTAPTVHPIDRIVAVVGKTAILATELDVAIEEWRARERPLPSDSNAAKLEVLDDLINIEILLQKARDFNITVTDDELAPEVDAYIRQVRDRSFQGDETAFRAALQTSEFKTLEGFRARQMDAQRKTRLQQLAIDSLRAHGRFPTVPVSEQELRTAFEQFRKEQPDLGAGITFRQIIMKVAPSDQERTRARGLADSLLAALRAGAAFDSVARAFSQDTENAARGGDLGYFRRGSMWPQFEVAAFTLQPGLLSGVVQTPDGYHIIRVDRVRPAEVSARHILIRERRDSADVARTREQVARIGAALRAGASFDSLAALYHDPLEDRVISDPYPIDSLPVAYREKLSQLTANQVSEPIDLVYDDAAPKVVVVQLLTRTETSAPTYDRIRERLLERTREARSLERLVATLRKEVYVDIRLQKLVRIGQ